MYDPSDEATGLPPLHEPLPEDSMLVLRWMLGHEGVVESPIEPEPMAVRWLSMRGLILDEAGNTQHGQVHVAIPSQAVRPMLEQWLLSLAQDEADPPVEP